VAISSKQVGRYLRYKLTFERMDDALEEGWLLEAISLQESIISDRLLSVLRHYGKVVESFQSLKTLIAECRRLTTGSTERVEGDFFDELDTWRIKRNRCIHEFCKMDDYAHDESSAEIFSETMFDTAKKGRELADLAKEYSTFMKKKIQALAPSP
jgi:hypothetical protein